MKKVKNYFNDIIKKGNTDIVQIRIPSLFSMAAYLSVKELKLPLTTYIAGDWKSSFTLNYKFFGNNLVISIFDFLQKKIIKNSVPVAAGPELAKAYESINSVYPYFSTTHKEAYNVIKNNDVLQLLYVGRLEELKRVQDGILALKILLNDGIKAELHIVGDGVKKQSIINLINELQIKEHVVMHGYISNEKQLEELYKIADIFILPSVSEGTPKVLTEAMSHGAIPIAVYNAGSVKHIIEDEKNGFLVEPYSPEQIAKKIKVLLNSNQLKLKMQQNCYEYAKEHTITKEVENMWKYIFEELKRNKKFS